MCQQPLTRLCDLACSISSNNLGGETGYVKAAEVQGVSKEVGAKVVYQGRKMIVRKGVDSDGELKMVDLSGVTALADALKANAALTSLECVAPRLSPKCQQPLTLAPRPRLQHLLQRARTQGRQAHRRGAQGQHGAHRRQVRHPHPTSLIWQTVSSR